MPHCSITFDTCRHRFDGAVLADCSSDNDQSHSWDSGEEVAPVAYAYEPARSHLESELEESLESEFEHSPADPDYADTDHGHRLGNSSWCSCGQCGPMPTV